MTPDFSEIMKEFDERFWQRGRAAIRTWRITFDGKKDSYATSTNDIKSFWLPKLTEAYARGKKDNWKQSEDDRVAEREEDYQRGRMEMLETIEKKVQDKMIYYRSENEDDLKKDFMMLAYDMNSRYVAMMHFLDALAALRSKEEELK